MRLTSIMKYSLYNIVKRRPVEGKASLLSLYKSRVFSGAELEETLAGKESAQRYKEFLPFMYLGTTDAFKAKILVTALDFNPEQQTLHVTSIRARGFVTQQFHLNNIIPLTYADMRAYNKLPQPLLPTYIDDTMTYFNKFNHDTYIFEFDGAWNQETVEHPKLSLDARLQEKEWFDRRHAY